MGNDDGRTPTITASAHLCYEPYLWSGWRGPFAQVSADSGYVSRLSTLCCYSHDSMSLLSRHAAILTYNQVPVACGMTFSIANLTDK